MKKYIYYIDNQYARRNMNYECITIKRGVIDGYISFFDADNTLICSIHGDRIEGIFRDYIKEETKS